MRVEIEDLGNTVKSYEHFKFMNRNLGYSVKNYSKKLSGFKV